MQTPEDRKINRFLSPLAEQLRLIVSHLDRIRAQQESSTTDQQQAISEATNRTVTAIANLQAIGAKAQQQKRGPGLWLKFWIETALCVFTALAFFAAAYYAHIARLQRDTMEKQWHTMNDTYLEIQKQTWAAIRASTAADEAATAAKDQVGMMKQQLETQEAYIPVKSSVTRTTNPLDKQLDYPNGVHLSLINRGQTTASNVLLSLSVDLKDIDNKHVIRNLTKHTWEIPTIKSSTQVLFGFAPVEPIEKTDNFMMSPEEIANYNGGDTIITTTAIVDYDTAFGSRKKDRACWVEWNYKLRDQFGGLINSGAVFRLPCDDFSAIATRIPALKENARKNALQGQPKN